jgi:hypothetical protein
MIASQLTHSTEEEFEEEFFLISNIASAARALESKIIPLSEEIFWIEGTVSVAF